MLNKGVDVNQMDKHQGSALMYASIGGHLEIIKLLLNHKANIQRDGNNCLTLAKKNNYKNVVELLKVEIAKVIPVNNSQSD